MIFSVKHQVTFIHHNKNLSINTKIYTDDSSITMNELTYDSSIRHIKLSDFDKYHITLVPAWSHPEKLKQSIKKFKNVDPDTYFGPFINVKIDLDKIFGNTGSYKNKTKKRRGKGKKQALWKTNDILSVDEHIKYKKFCNWM